MDSNSLKTNFENEIEETTFGNKHLEVEFVRRLLFEFGLPNEEENEIDRIITQVKVDMFQDEMKKLYDPEMVGNGL